MARIHLIIGPVGAGKSTFAKKLSEEHRAPRLILDEWMALLFRPDRPEDGVFAWYRERTERCVEMILRVSESILATGTDVVLEIGMIFRADRLRLYQRVDAAQYPLAIYVLEASREARRERVEKRNLEKGPTFSMAVPPEIFEMASDLWEMPEKDELANRDARIIFTDST
jgi:predicted kinase